MADLGSAVFSQTDGANDSGTHPSWSGSANPSTIDNAGRALQGALTREWNWRSYTLTAAGTADVKTLTYAVAPAAYYNGQVFAFINNTTNTGSVTVNVNSLGAKSLKYINASGTATALASGEMIAGQYIEATYNLAGDTLIWTNYPGVWSTGTFTPTMDFSTTGNLSVSYSVQTGTYTRIRNLVHYYLYLVCTPSGTTPSGAMLIKGLPFSSAASPAAPFNYAGSVIVANTVYESGMIAAVAPGQSLFRIRRMDSSAALNTVDWGDLIGAAEITVYASGTYMV